MYLCRLLKLFHDAKNIIHSLLYALFYLLLKVKSTFCLQELALLFETYEI